MLALAELQARLAIALLEGRWESVEEEVAPGPLLASEALTVHRNTTLSGLVNALRLSFPTVDLLVGEMAFDQVALSFIADHPPGSAWLTAYGAGFAEFLTAYPSMEGLPYLADVARLDHAIEVVSGEAFQEAGVVRDLGAATLTLDSSLRLIGLDYPAVAVRDAVHAGDEALAALRIPCEPHSLVVWRGAEGVLVRRLDSFPAAVLAALLRGDVEVVSSEDGDLAALQAQVLAAPFARIDLTPVETSNP